MPTPIEVLNHKITLAIGVITLVGMGLAVMDSRHASASDLQGLTQMILDDRIEDLEYKIEDVEDAIARIMREPTVDRAPWTDQELHDLENLKERYLRKLNRLLGDN